MNGRANEEKVTIYNQLPVSSSIHYNSLLIIILNVIIISLLIPTYYQVSAFALCSSDLSSVLLIISAICLFRKVSLSPDIILRGLLGLKHQLTNIRSLYIYYLLGLTSTATSYGSLGSGGGVGEWGGGWVTVSFHRIITLSPPD